MAALVGTVWKSREMTCRSGSITRASDWTMNAAVPSTSSDARPVAVATLRGTRSAASVSEGTREYTHGTRSARICAGEVAIRIVEHEIIGGFASDDDEPAP